MNLSVSKTEALRLLKVKIESGEEIIDQITSVKNDYEFEAVLDKHEIWLLSVKSDLTHIFGNSEINQRFPNNDFIYDDVNEIIDAKNELKEELLIINTLITEIGDNKYSQLDETSIIDKLKAKYQRTPLYKTIAFLIAIIITLSTMLDLVVKFKENTGKITDDAKDYISLKVSDVYYLSESSKVKNFPKAVTKLNTSIPSDDESQTETMKYMQLYLKPIIKYTITNSNTTTPIKIQGVFLEINGSDYLEYIESQYDRDEAINCPPNNSTDYTGVPIMYPVYKLDKEKLKREWLPNEAQKLYAQYNQNNPNEVLGRIVILFPDSSTMTINQPFRINKKEIKDLKPSISY